LLFIKYKNTKKNHPSPLNLVRLIFNPNDTIPELNDQSPDTCHYTILQRSGTLPGGGCKLLEIPREVKPGAIPTYQVFGAAAGGIVIV
jgi:hypothetical protein